MGISARRWRRLANEVSRFTLVGGLATIVAFILFNLLVHGFYLVDPVLNNHPLTGYVIANTFGMLISYQGTRSFVFPHRAATSADRGFVAYVVINIATMTLPLACLWFSRAVLGLSDPIADNLSANVIGLAAGFVARFYLFRQVVFNQPQRRRPPGGPTDPSSGGPAAPASSEAAGR